MRGPTGATTALITPFKDGKLDEETYEKLIIRQIDNNIDAVCPVGTTGESATLNTQERNRSSNMQRNQHKSFSRCWKQCN